MELFLLRHAKAIDPADPDSPPRDADRKLTAAGERQARKVGRGLAALELDIELIITSPLPRAAATAEIVAAELGLDKAVVTSDALAAGASPGAIVRMLKKHSAGKQRVMLVGHEPDFSKLASVLLTGNTSLKLTLKKAGLCRLKLAGLKPGRCAQLEWLITAGQLGKIGRRSKG